MQSNCFNRKVLSSPRRLAMPIAVYPGLALTGASVADVVTSSQAQFEAQQALYKRYQTPFALSAMDLSAEAEAFGCTLFLSPNEIPSVTGRLVTTLQAAEALRIPVPGEKRTAVHLETVRKLKQLEGQPLVFGGCIGPFSLAARLVGVSEAMELTVNDPDLMTAVVEKSATFLNAYAQAFKAAGADGIIMAEPAAGLLSPRSMARFSSAYIRQITQPLLDGHFTVILHNCAAKVLHLPAILETGLSSFHFGAPMDVAAALGKVPGETVLCGNLDPAAVFCQMAPEQIAERVTSLTTAVTAHKNFVVSSGCDIPPAAPLASLDALYAAVK